MLAVKSAVFSYIYVLRSFLSYLRQNLKTKRKRVQCACAIRSIKHVAKNKAKFTCMYCTTVVHRIESGFSDVVVQTIIDATLLDLKVLYKATLFQLLWLY